MKATLIYPETPSPSADNVDGAAIRSYVKSLGFELRNHGHEVSVQALDGDPMQSANSAVTKLADSLSESRPDIVHAHLWASGLASLAALRQASDLERTPIVLTPHSMNLPDTAEQPSRKKWLRLKAAVAHDVDRVTASSRRERADLINLGVRRRAIDLIPHGVDTQEFTPDSAELMHGSAPQVLAVGPLRPQTGLATAIEALPALPDANLTVAGSPAGGQSSWEIASDQEAARLHTLARKLGVSDRTTIVAVPDREKLPALLRSADVLVCTPWHETSNAIDIEAMACGRPVVGTTVGELPDVIIEGTTGVLVPPRRPRVLAKALRDLLGDPIRLNGYAMASAHRAQARYAWPRVAHEVSQAYESAIAA